MQITALYIEQVIVRRARHDTRSRALYVANGNVRRAGIKRLAWHCDPHPPLCISYALVQATVGVGTVKISYVI